MRRRQRWRVAAGCNPVPIRVSRFDSYTAYLTMEESIGRPLKKCENIHHKNGVKDDNRIENLEIWNTYQPSGQRVEDKIDWAVEILRLYRPDLLT